MMLFAVFCCFLCAAWGVDAKIAVSVSAAQVTELRQIAQTCGKEFGVDPNALRNMLTGDMPNDKSHKEFLYCICSSTGYVDTDGHFIVEKMSVMIPETGTTEEYAKNLEECNKTTLENKLETLFELLACFHKSYTPKVSAMKAP